MLSVLSLDGESSFRVLYAESVPIKSITYVCLHCVDCKTETY